MYFFLNISISGVPRYLSSCLNQNKFLSNYTQPIVYTWGVIKHMSVATKREFYRSVTLIIIYVKKQIITQ